MRKYIVGGNWKQNGSVKFSKDFTSSVINTLKFDAAKTQVVIAPSAIHLPLVKQALTNQNVFISAQNISQYKNGAYTGETSAEMLNDMEIKWTILGHSERRHVFGETDQVTGEKVGVALKHKINVIGCIGEKLEEREANQTMTVCERQLEAMRPHVDNWDNFVIAYEPVWAIGTGKTASPEQAQEVHEQVRAWIEKKVGKDVAAKTRIMYGGSVTDKNANELITKKDVDGFLVGGASLKESFVDIVKACSEAKRA